MVSPKSLENLKKGREKGRQKKYQTNAGPTWKDLIEQYGQTEPPPELSHLGKTWKAVVVAAAFRQAASGNAAILKELMQRSEPLDPKLLNLDLSKLSLEQLQRLANGDELLSVLATPSASGD